MVPTGFVKFLTDSARLDVVVIHGSTMRPNRENRNGCFEHAALKLEQSTLGGRAPGTRSTVFPPDFNRTLADNFKVKFGVMLTSRMYKNTGSVKHNKPVSAPIKLLKRTLKLQMRNFKVI